MTWEEEDEMLAKAYEKGIIRIDIPYYLNAKDAD